MNNKKAILCHTCRNVESSLSNGKKLIDVCYYPDNNRKLGHATKCEEYDKAGDVVVQDINAAERV